MYKRQGQAAGVARDELAQMVLRQQVDGEAVFEYGDAGMPADRLDERPFDLGARPVSYTHLWGGIG